LKTLCIVAFMLLAAFMPKVEAADIIWITDGTNDTGYSDALMSMGYTVQRENGTYNTNSLSSAKIAELSTAKLIVLSPLISTTGSYARAAASWNMLETPILALTGDILMDNQLKWFNTTNFNSSGYQLYARVENDAAFNGISTNKFYTKLNPATIAFPLSANAGFGSFLASATGGVAGDDPLIARFSPCDLAAYDGGAVLNGDRAEFVCPDLYNDLTAEGETVFSNMVADLIKPATNIALYSFNNLPAVGSLAGQDGWFAAAGLSACALGTIYNTNNVLAVRNGGNSAAGRMNNADFSCDMSDYLNGDVACVLRCGGATSSSCYFGLGIDRNGDGDIFAGDNVAGESNEVAVLWGYSDEVDKWYLRTADGVEHFSTNTVPGAGAYWHLKLSMNFADNSATLLVRLQNSIQTAVAPVSEYRPVAGLENIPLGISRGDFDGMYIRLRYYTAVDSIQVEYGEERPKGLLFVVR